MKEESITLYTDKWKEAFIISQALYDISPKLLFPRPSTQESSIFSNPDKEEFVWHDEMKVSRNGKGELLSILYSKRLEGGAWSVLISASDENMEGLKITWTGIVD